jgi:hypothetical protein
VEVTVSETLRLVAHLEETAALEVEAVFLDLLFLEEQEQQVKAMLVAIMLVVELHFILLVAVVELVLLVRLA